MEKQVINDFEIEVVFEGNSVYRGKCPKCGDNISVAGDGFVPHYSYSQKCRCGLTWSVKIEVKFQGEQDDW